MIGREHWLAVARDSDADDLRESILSGYKTGKPFTPYVPTLQFPSHLSAVLDFGCGIGRNFPFLKTIASSVAGFDLPPMIERCRALATAPIAELTARWEEVNARRFDLIFAALVLQHLEPETCDYYLREFARMSPILYLLTRTGDDFGSSVLSTVSDTGLFDSGECVEVEHDPDTHQLLALGKKSFSDACLDSGGAHYELLLRSRIYAQS
jgi:SAM-dependent methyltransferase